MATVTMTTGPRVAGGHVAAWVGVGGVGLGPNGTDQWLQVGFGSTDSATTSLYYEVARPHAAPRFVALLDVVQIGQSHRIGVIEMQSQPGWWRVWVDGTPVTPPISLESSHDRSVPRRHVRKLERRLGLVQRPWLSLREHQMVAKQP